MSEELAPPSRVSCAHCAVGLTPRSPSGARACPDCGGELWDRASLEALVAHVSAGAASRPYARPVLSLAAPVRYIPCPVCREPMLRRNYEGCSGVIVDVCSSHGVWFDRGELAQVLEFCASGELARARARAAEREERMRRPDELRSRLFAEISREREDSRALDIIAIVIDALTWLGP